MAKQAAHTTKKRRNIYIVGEELDFVWDEDEVIEVKEMMDKNIPSWAIASSFGRPEIEVNFLLLDLKMKGGVINEQQNRGRD